MASLPWSHHARAPALSARPPYALRLTPHASLMNILLVNWQDLHNPQAGGAEIHLFEIFSRLVRRGHRVRLVCSGFEGGAAFEQVQGIDVRRHGTRYTFALLGRRAVRRALATERTDVVVEDINKLPLYLTNLTQLPLCALVPHLFGTTAFDEAPLPLATAVWLAELPLARGYSRAGFHAISESTRDDLVARGVPRDRIRVIHPGVDLKTYFPDPSVPRAGVPTFVYVGRLKRYKGVGLLLEALTRARAKRPEIRLLIAGTGDARPELERMARDLGQEAAVQFLGFIPETEKLALLRTAWANVFPSVKEGWGITVIEAAACGTPSIASDSPGLRDSVRDGETGVLVPHGDVEALAQRLTSFADDSTLVRRLGEAARRYAETLTWDAAAAATEAHLHELTSTLGAR